MFLRSRQRRSVDESKKLEEQCSSGGSNQTNAPPESLSASPSAKAKDSQSQEVAGGCSSQTQPKEGQQWIMPLAPEPVPRIDCCEDINELLKDMVPKLAPHIKFSENIEVQQDMQKDIGSCVQRRRPRALAPMPRIDCSLDIQRPSNAS
eukprot:TRINITY_DN1898_c0_g3_i2.p1 TRINITY_DN1898_c0_g3~~TRINITY_DN1898_c0_g3_i2.p1  ORF type:complete len:149 (-),score=39.22 TRINITY_DN1898_c0_g3_i2:45-491(-)